MKATETATTLREGWDHVLEQIDEQGEAILQQVENAKHEYPELVAVFKMLVCYVGFAHRERLASLVLAPEPQVEGEFGGWPLPSILRPGSILTRCAQGDTDACRAIDPKHGFSSDLGPPVSCDGLKAEYEAAKAKELKALLEAMKGPATAYDGGSFKLVLAQKAESEKILQRMIELGCILTGARIKLPL